MKERKNIQGRVTELPATVGIGGVFLLGSLGGAIENVPHQSKDAWLSAC